MPLDHRGVHIITQEEVDITMAYLKEIGGPSSRRNARGALKDALRRSGIRSQDPSREAHDRCRHALYNLTCVEFDAMQDRAAGCCERCGISADQTPHQRLYIDHDHSTGRARGLLCPSCNTLMSRVDAGRRDPDDRTTRYLALSASHTAYD